MVGKGGAQAGEGRRDRLTEKDGLIDRQTRCHGSDAAAEALDRSKARTADNQNASCLVKDIATPEGVVNRGSRSWRACGGHVDVPVLEVCFARRDAHLGVETTPCRKEGLSVWR